jgi:nucleotide-binding universal stress UspA family protein
MTQHENLPGAPTVEQAEGDGRRRVVVGVDGTAGSRAALEYAWAAAAARDAELEVVGAFSVEDYWLDPRIHDPLTGDGIRAHVEQTVTALVAEVRNDPSLHSASAVPVRTVVMAGRAAAVLIDGSEDADLLVVGSRGRGMVRSALLGSVSLHCVTHARCPVVVVHPRTEDATGPARVVVGLDGSERSRTALLSALDEARRLGADVEAVAAYELVDTWTDMGPVTLPSAEQIRAVVERRIQDLVTEVLDLRPGDGAPGPSIGVSVVEGSARDELVSRARGAALLVVGSTGRGELRSMLLGSVALHCAMHAPCPVMVVHPGARRTAADPAGREQPVAAR